MLIPLTLPAAAALKQISKALDLNCIICTYFDKEATDFWLSMGFSQEKFNLDEQRIYEKHCIQYPDMQNIKFAVEGFEQDAAKQESIDKVVSVIRKLMDVQRAVFKQQLKEMHEMKARADKLGKRKASEISAGAS